jgi:two-component system, chemotaxis family, chemotaxis protein CheY
MSGARILVVDDDDATREVISQILQDEGYRISDSADGDHALRMLDGSADLVVDLILLDLRMPVMNGPQFVEAYRSQPGPCAPIVLITAQSSEDAAVHANDLGAVGFLSKPFDLDELLATVGRCLKPAMPGGDGDGSMADTYRGNERIVGAPALVAHETGGPSPAQQAAGTVASVVESLALQPAPTMPIAPPAIGMAIPMPPAPGAGASKEESESLERRRLMERLRLEVDRMILRIAQARAEVRKISALESTRRLTAQEKRWAASVRLENERLRFELEALRQEFFTMRDGDDRSRRPN